MQPTKWWARMCALLSAFRKHHWKHPSHITWSISVQHFSSTISWGVVIAAMMWTVPWDLSMFTGAKKNPKKLEYVCCISVPAKRQFMLSKLQCQNGRLCPSRETGTVVYPLRLNWFAFALFLQFEISPPLEIWLVLIYQISKTLIMILWHLTLYHKRLHLSHLQ
jgi:hypothetical protein